MHFYWWFNLSITSDDHFNTQGVLILKSIFEVSLPSVTTMGHTVGCSELESSPVWVPVIIAPPQNFLRPIPMSETSRDWPVSPFQWRVAMWLARLSTVRVNCMCQLGWTEGCQIAGKSLLLSESVRVWGKD